MFLSSSLASFMVGTTKKQLLNLASSASSERFLQAITTCLTASVDFLIISVLKSWLLTQQAWSILLIQSSKIYLSLPSLLLILATIASFALSLLALINSWKASCWLLWLAIISKDLDCILANFINVALKSGPGIEPKGESWIIFVIRWVLPVVSLIKPCLVMRILVLIGNMIFVTWVTCSLTLEVPRCWPWFLSVVIRSVGALSWRVVFVTTVNTNVTLLQFCRCVAHICVMWSGPTFCAERVTAAVLPQVISSTCWTVNQGPPFTIWGGLWTGAWLGFIPVLITLGAFNFILLLMIALVAPEIL